MKAGLNNYFVLFILITLSLLSCGEGNQNEIQYVYDGQDSLKCISILQKNGIYYIINGKHYSDTIPENYIVNSDRVLEYFPGLVKWRGERVYIYSSYGQFDSSHSGKNMVHQKLKNIDFNKLQVDSNITYFFYPE